MFVVVTIEYEGKYGFVFVFEAFIEVCVKKFSYEFPQ